MVEDAGLQAADIADSQQLPPEQRYPVLDVSVVNSSPGGYGLEWPKDIAPDLRAGDLVCIRESGSESEDWSVGAVRWVDQPTGEHTRVGVELLSPYAKAYGAVIHHKTGKDAEPMRVLLLPEIKLVGQSHTMLTPRAGFKDMQKITLLREGEEFLIQLQQPVAVTGSFARFGFRYIKQLEEVVAEDLTGVPDSAYDSVWSSI